MKFEEIFNNVGWYVADSFTEGTVIFIEPGPHGNELRFMAFENVNSLSPVEFKINLYQQMFTKNYVKVLNRQSLFGEKRLDLFK